jgi:hypothetical protein
MRMIAGIALAIVLALVVGFSAQVMIGQAREKGAFMQRVTSVIERRFGFAAPLEAATPPAAMVAAGRSMEDETALTPEIAAAVRLVADHYAEKTKAEVVALKEDLVRQEQQRDAESFWTDVRLNTLFMLLGFGVPVLMRRLGSYW